MIIKPLQAHITPCKDGILSAYAIIPTIRTIHYTSELISSYTILYNYQISSHEKIGTN